MQDYEELRRCIIAGKVARSSGLSLLVSRGVAAWLQLVSVTPSLPQVVSNPEPASTLADVHSALRDEMVSVIANMMLRTKLENAYAV